MGCSGGSCGLRRYTTQQEANAGCAMCAQDAYRLRARNAFNPWAMNAGASPALTPDQIALLNVPGDKSTMGGQDMSGGGGTFNPAAIIPAVTQGIAEIGNTARAQIAADAQRAHDQALAQAGLLRSTQQGLSAPQAASSSGSIWVLVGLAAVAAVATGAVKLPRMSGR